MKTNNFKTKTIAAVLAAITTASVIGSIGATSVAAAETPTVMAQDIKTTEASRKKMMQETIPAATKAQKSEKEKALEKEAQKEAARKEKENEKINQKEAILGTIEDTAIDFAESLIKAYIGQAYKQLFGKSPLAKVLKKKGSGIIEKLTDNKKDKKLSKEGQAIIESVTKLENLMSDNQEQTERSIEAIIDTIKNSRFKNVYSDLENDYNNSLKQVDFIAKQLAYIRLRHQVKDSAANIKARLTTHDPHKMCRLFDNFFTELNKDTVTVNGEKRSAALEQYIKNRFSEVRRSDSHNFTESSADYNRLRKEINKELELMAQLSINDYYIIKLYLQANKEIVGITDTVQTKAALESIERVLDSDFRGIISFLDKSYLDEDIIKAEVTVDGLTKGYLNFADAYSAAFSAKKAVIKLTDNVTADELKGLNTNSVSAVKGFNGTNGLLVNDKKDITIDFNGKTIDCRDRGITLFTVSPSCKLTLKNGTVKNIDSLINYRSDQAVTTEIRMENVKVVNSKKHAVNIADKSKNSSFVFEKCTFENVKDGAGIYGDFMNTKAVTINNCSFIKCNNSKSGGAISFNTVESTGSILTVTNCVFENNTSKQNGGALFFADAKNCRFIGNKAKDGGAIYIAKNVKNCQFENNSTLGDVSYGGAVAYLRGTAENCSFNNNSSTYGGAVYATTPVTMKNITANRNTAAKAGGAFYLTDSGNVIDGLDCSSNKAGFGGGGIYFAFNSGTAKSTLKNANFIYNHAGKNGGAVYCTACAFNSVDLTLEGTVKAYHNTAGDAEKANDFFLDTGLLAKSKLITTDNFNSKDSIVNVASESNSEVAVCELSNAAHKSAFASSQGRSIYTGSYYTKTVYLGKA